MTGILGYASYLKTLLPEDEKKFHAANSIEISARRAADLTRLITEYSHKEMPTHKPVKIDQVAEEAFNELSAVAPDKVHISVEFGASAVLVLGDKDTLIRSLLHLGENAIEAMPDGGRLTISTRPFVSDGENVEFDGFPVYRGDYVSIIVSDTGCGIPEQTRKQVFDCFFTTKPEGNGIGLAMVRRCVRKHKGFLRMDSREDGMVFEILLPALPSTS
ncbi:MAG: HAMP domain-containing histidine kinase [Syntrophorhabdaceae bacterium]|nr:HAMP domain-containing histidine kinase [Syntrophorhabdaceae bacterium]